jgi:long-chain acyl-CoA synthetase
MIATFPTPIEVVKNYHVDVNLQIRTPDMALDMESALTTAEPIDTQSNPFRGMFAYTFGSTNRPKGIKHDTNDDSADSTDSTDSTDKYLVYKSLSQPLMQLTTNDCFYLAAPIYHSAPNTLSLCSFAASDINIYISTKCESEHFLDAIEKYKFTHLYIVPTMMILRLKLPQTIREKYDLSSLKYALFQGSAFPTNIKSAMINWLGSIFYESYGTGEIGFMTLISSSEALHKPSSVGKVVAGGKIKILGENRQELGPYQLLQR